MELTREEKELISELLNIASKLPKEEQEHLLWLGQGILFANQKNDR